MSNESKGTPKPFSSDLFSSTPSSLSGLNLGSDSKSFLGGPIPFIVPQQGGASASPAKKDENAPTEPFGSTSPSPPSPIERPASASLTQVDLSDDAPPGKEESPHHVGGGGGAAATQHHHPVFGAAAPVATSAELDLAGSRHVPVQQPLPRQHSSPPSIAATSLQPQGPLPPLSSGPYNPYRANPLQHQHQQRPPAPVQYPAQQFVPVAEPYPSQVAPLATAVPHQHQQHHDHHHGEECHHDHDHDHGHHEHHHEHHQHQHQQHGPPPPPVGLPSVSLHYHWFYLSPKGYWTPFSLTDSNNLEMVHASGDDIVVPTDGGRYDVHVKRRRRIAAYWSETETEVRRTTWFYKGEEDRYYVPYPEAIADKLEAEYQSSIQSRVWNKWVDVGDGSTVAFHNPSVIVEHLAPVEASSQLSVGGERQPTRTRIVKRGFDEADQMDQGEFPVIEHLVFVVHGLAPAADDRHQSVLDTVDDFRLVAESLLHAHQLPSRTPGGRVEFLPVLWHSVLSDDPRIVNDRLRTVNLASISRLRDFNNHSLMDLLFYTSPVYCEKIVKFVASEMNRILALFMTRNPGFSGTVSVMGHSLGSCILFDVLSHQKLPGEATAPTQVKSEEPSPDTAVEESEPTSLPSLDEGLEQLGLTDLLSKFEAEQVDMDSLMMCTGDDLKEMGIPMGPRKKLLGFIKEQLTVKEEIVRKRAEAKERAEAQAKLEREEEARRLAAEQADNPIRDFKCRSAGVGIGEILFDCPQLDFSPTHLFACGSPVGFFLAIRSDDGVLGTSYRLPSCPSVFNVFHPYDPLAYRLEPLIESSIVHKPILMPHHKGRKRFHLELKENLGRMGANLKRQIIQGVRQTWQTLNEFARSHYSGAPTESATDEDVASDRAESIIEDTSAVVEDVSMGNLNGGRRVDYVLQEKAIESLNEYLFAFSSHFSYWQSEDTALMILKEIYGADSSLSASTTTLSSHMPSEP